MVQVFLNGKPWTEHSKAVYGNKTGMCSSDKYCQQLCLGQDCYFDTVEELLAPWKNWKQQREYTNSLRSENGMECTVKDFFYEANVEKDCIAVTWGWIDTHDEFLKAHDNVSELKMKIVMKITDVKVDLDNFEEIKHD